MKFINETGKDVFYGDFRVPTGTEAVGTSSYEGWTMVCLSTQKEKIEVERAAIAKEEGLDIRVLVLEDTNQDSYQLEGLVDGYEE